MKLRIAIVVASTRDGRVGPVIAEWAREQAAARENFEVEVVDLEDAALPERLSRDVPASVVALHQRLAAADAFVIVVPEYNHSYPAPLKTALDWTSRAWAFKPVAFVSYGGRSGGIRAVEHLRGVLPELNSMSIRESLSLHDVWGLFDGEGRLKVPAGTEAATRAMFEQLTWWAGALKRERGRS